ncbi:MAG: hypothetical protein QME92_00885 [Bacillota bacterium]|nr:hypothetical protein [Bacillota bacterium]
MRMLPPAAVVAFLVMVVLGAAIGVGMMAVHAPVEKGSPPARATAIAMSAIPERWRELQKPLPAVTQEGREEEPVVVPARGDDDPFAPDSSIARYYRTQGQRPASTGPMPAGGDEVSRIIAAASAKNASKPATKPDGPAEKPAAKPKEDAKPVSSPAAESAPPVTVAQLPAAPAAGEEPRATDSGASSAPEGKLDSAPEKGPVETSKGESAPPAIGAHAAASDVAGAPKARAGEGPAGQTTGSAAPGDESVGTAPPAAGEKKPEGHAVPEKPPAGSDAGKPATASRPEATASKTGGPTPAGTSDAGKESPAVTVPGPESKPAEPVPPPKPRVEPPLMLVTGIISAGDSAYAIVRTPQGSSIVRPGDEIGGVTVKSVGEKSIVVLKEGEEFVLELGGGGKR